MTPTYAILVAGGTGSRFGSGSPKQFQIVLGKPLLAHTVDRFRDSGVIAKVILVLPREGFEEKRRSMAHYVGDASPVHMVPGGESRQASMVAGLSFIEPGFEGLVAVHDGARPAVPATLIARVVEAAAADGGAIAAVPVVETIKEATDELLVQRTVPRARLYRAQTPQCFRYPLLTRAVQKAAQDGFEGTDEAALVERLNAPIRIVLGSEQNLKVTTAEDLERVEYYLRKGET